MLFGGLDSGMAKEQHHERRRVRGSGREVGFRREVSSMGSVSLDRKSGSEERECV